MELQLSSGVGTGPTKLAAFDAALRDAGIANYNLLVLSSVIPPGSEIVEVDSASTSGEWGDRLYVVLAEERTADPNAEAWAGIGWVQNQETGKGLFVEHHGASEQAVRADITDSLKALVEGRNEEFGPINMKIQGTICHRDPVCSLVAAVYKSEPWGDVKKKKNWLKRN